jgi:hypothetical protein
MKKITASQILLGASFLGAATENVGAEPLFKNVIKTCFPNDRRSSGFARSAPRNDEIFKIRRVTR